MEEDFVSASVVSNMDTKNNVPKHSQEFQPNKATFIKLYVNAISPDVLDDATQATKTAATKVEPSIESTKSEYTYISTYITTALLSSQ